MTTRELRRVGLEGELTIMTAGEQKDRLLTALEGSAGLRVDLSAVEEIDTAGLQVLLLAQREAERLNLAFELGGSAGSVAAVCALAGLAGTGPAAEEE
ncbi:lipid asymmetry maintenance protein MlaB [Actinoplanes sp. NPDC051859]|uniref:lipid asymmetry maintenance protein MlaB n=1 Tax=Actinoplanes sp. NPDC051859 TaxID=3363909 RepID=UPI0037B8E819